jgi:(p)ppGpp synthase/HD superfamily hydrolase
MRRNYDERLIDDARMFAVAAHAAIGQKRKYTGEDYITHPDAVVKILRRHVPTVTAPMLAAAWLHDVLEDTQVTFETIRFEFGEEVAGYVLGLSHASKPEDGNRETRKMIDAKFLEIQCAEVQTIKVADLMHNTISIVHHDKGFAQTYIPEKMTLLKLMTKADKTLLELAHKQIHDNWRF